jgi:hypothetical protein
MVDMQDIFGQVLSPKALDLINSYCQKFSAFPNTGPKQEPLPFYAQHLWLPEARQGLHQ